MERKQEWATNLERVISHQQVPLSKIITTASFPYLIQTLLSFLIKGAGLRKPQVHLEEKTPCTGVKSCPALLSLDFSKRVGGALVLPQVPAQALGHCRAVVPAGI